MKGMKGILRTAVGVIIIVLIWWGFHEAHLNSLSHQASVVQSDLGNQHVTGIGTPNAATHIVPIQVEPGCTVNFSYEVDGSQVTLEIKYYDAAGLLIGNTDTITDAKSETQVVSALDTLLARNPSNTVCK